MTKSAKIMVGYGMFLVLGACVAISISGWDRSKTALASSGAAAMLLMAMAFLNSRPRTAKFGQIGGTVLPALFAGTFFWRLTLNWAKPSEAEWTAANPGKVVETALIESPLQNWLFPTFIVGSLLAFALILALRDPQK